jgi:hypothetical protein
MKRAMSNNSHKEMIIIGEFHVTFQRTIINRGNVYVKIIIDTQRDVYQHTN